MTTVTTTGWWDWKDDEYPDEVQRTMYGAGVRTGCIAIELRRMGLSARAPAWRRATMLAFSDLHDAVRMQAGLDRCAEAKA